MKNLVKPSGMRLLPDTGRAILLLLGLTITFSCSKPPPLVKMSKAAATSESGDDNGVDPTTDDGESASVGVPLPPTPTPDPLTPMPVPPVVTPSVVKPEDLVMDPGTDGDGDHDLDRNYTVAPETVKDDKIPHGAWKTFAMNSEDSKIYQGQDSYLKEKGNFTRQGWLYLPAGYVEGTELPFMVVGDGSWGQHQELLRWSVDSLIYHKKIPAMALVLINPGPLGGGDGPGSQRSFEYDSVTDKFVTWVETEVLPKMTKDFNVKFTTNPEGRGTMGGSSSGAMAFTMAWFRPDLYRRVLTYSGTFVNRISTEEHPSGAWEYHSKMIGSTDKKPIRITIHASEHDNNLGNENDWLAANRAMAKVFKEKGYHYRFLYAPDAGHIDDKVYKETLPDNLIWLWRGYPIK